MAKFQVTFSGRSSKGNAWVKGFVADRTREDGASTQVMALARTSNGDLIKDTIPVGVIEGHLAYTPARTDNDGEQHPAGYDLYIAPRK